MTVFYLRQLRFVGEGFYAAPTVGGQDLCVVLTNSTLAAGKVPLALAAGCTLNARTAWVMRKGRMKWLRPADYTSANLPDLVGGGGTLRVRELGCVRGQLFFVR